MCNLKDRNYPSLLNSQEGVLYFSKNTYINKAYNTINMSTNQFGLLQKSVLTIILLTILAQFTLGQIAGTPATVTMTNAPVTIATGTYITYYDPGGAAASYGTADYTQTITSTNGQPLLITFTQFALQSNSGNDYLIIHDGATTAAISLGTFNRSNSPGTIRTSGASVTFEFITNNNTGNDGMGWVATLTSMVTTDADVNTCSAAFTDKQGGANYTANQYYKVTYRATTPGQKLRFIFSEFNLGAGDQLTVLNGDQLNSPLIGNYIGNGSPGTITSSDTTLTFIFSSNNDAATVGTGWSAAVDCYTVKTYYSYTNGTWNNPATWTLDASGTIYNNPSSAIPTALDNAVILNGRTITVTNNGNTVQQLEIQQGAILDVTNSNTQNYGTVSGKGRLRSTSGDLPTGTYTLFTQSGGGTIELYGNITASPDLNISTFNNLEMNGDAGQSLYMVSNTQVNGNILVKGGSLFINHNGGVALDLIVLGNINVNPVCTLSMGNGSANHNLYLKGDLENEGTIIFTDRTIANGYTTDPTFSVTLTFNNSTKNQSLNCNGPTTLQRLIVNKGTDDTYMLDVNANINTNFLLYGRNDQASTNVNSPGDVVNNKALEVYAGTLHLGANISIPRLLTAGAGSNLYYTIDQDATIIVDGSIIGVTEQINISSIVIYGKLKVMGSSTFSSSGSQGVILREYGIFEIEGSSTAPTINTSAFRTSSRLDLGTHRGTFIMSGGILNISGDNYADSHPAFALPFGDNTIQISSGTINITNSTFYTGGTGGGINWSWLVSANESNISITGGTVNINATNRNAYINSTAPFYNLNFTGNATYSNQIQSIADQWYGGEIVVPAAPLRELVVLNNLSIGANCTFITNNQDVTVGKNFTITGTYTPGTNTTTFDGYGLQAFTNTGIITTGLYNLSLINSSLLTISNNLTIRNNLLMDSGTTFRDGGFTINVAGNITNSSKHESTTGGSITLNGTLDQVITGNGNGIFGNLYLNKTAGITNQNSNIAITGNLRLANTSAILNIGSNKLALSATSNIYDALTLTSTTGFSNTRMIQTAGIQSDLGIEKTYSTIGTTIFPVGVSGKYTPAKVEMDAAPTAWGTITINPVNTIHPLVTGVNALTYYWNVRRSEMSGFALGNLRLKFYYANADVSGAENLYIPAFYYPTVWTFVNDVNKVTDATNEILFDAIDQPRGHYTAGESSAFGAVQTYYSRQSGNWSDLSGANYTSWTNDPIGNAPATTLPAMSSPVIIRTGHTITVPAGENNKLLGSLEIQNNAVLDLTTSTGHFFGMIYQSTISGTGKLRISSATTSAQFPGGDFGEFFGDNGGTVEYYTTGAQDFTMPAGAKTTTTLLSEGFEGAFPPTGWVRYNLDGVGTQWIRSTTYSRSGAASAAHTYSTASNQNGMLVSPVLNMSEAASYELTFYRYNFWPTYYAYQGIWISTTTNASGSFSELIALGQGVSSWQQFTIDLSAYAGNANVYIAFVYRGNNADDVYIDDVTVTQLTGTSYYHHLVSNPAASRTITLPNINVTTSGNFTVKGAGITASTSLQTSIFTVEGKTLIDETGTLRLDNSKAQTLNLNDTLYIASGGSLLVNTAGANAVAHRIKLYGDIINRGTINLNSGSTKYSDIYFLGSKNQTFSGDGTTANINRVYVDKGTSQTPIIDITANTFDINPSLTQALTLTNGTIRFSGPSLNLALTSTSSFTIPQTGCLSVNGSTVTMGTSATDAADIFLSGKLDVRAGTMNVGASANNNHNDIEYGTGGTPEVAVSGGTLNVNGQIRRSTTIATGNLTYRQSGGDVYIYGKNRDANQIKRALLEVLNSGSFYSSNNCNLYLVQGVTSTEAANTFGELYLNPTTYAVTGGTIHTGTSTTAVATNNFNLYLGTSIWSLTVNGEINSKIAILNTFPATFNGNLTIGSSGGSASYFVTSGLTVNIGGNLENYSTATYPYYYNTYDYANLGRNTGLMSTQITRFFGSMATQNVISNGTGLFRIGNIVIDKTAGKANFSGSKNYIVFGDINITQGELVTNNQYITLTGNLINNGSHSSIGVNGYINFYNNSTISGTNGSSVGIITISSNKAVTSSISFTINTKLSLGANSKLSIGDKMLTFSSFATVTGVTPTAYIVTNGALSDQGVKREYSAAGSFTFPIGVGSEGGKYTPATINVTNTGGAAGAITVKPVDAPHPMRTNALNDELQYFWSVSSTGFGATPTITHSYTYSDLDIVGTEATYVNARLFNFAWTKQTEVVDFATNTIKFTGVNFIDGDYTAGEVTNWGIVHKYYSRGSGNWSNAGSWWLDSPTGPTAASTAPNGNPVFIQAGHTITTNLDGAYAGSVDIAATATLDLGSKIGHNMGFISGGGTIRIDATGAGSFVFPGGDPTSFMNTTGSTVEFSGAGTIPSNITTYQNILFTGNNTKIIPATDITVLGNLTISAGNVDNNINDRAITLYGNWNSSVSGGYISGTGKVTLAGGNAQTITATGGENFYNFEVNKTAGTVATLNSVVNVNRLLTLTSGIVNTESNLLTMTWDDSNALSGGSATAFVDGPLRKLVRNSGTFTFPVGDATRYGKVYISGVTSTGNQYWTARYYNVAPSNPTNLTPPLQLVSNNEYWAVTGVAGTTANVRIRWDGNSQIIPATALGREKLRVAEYTTAWTKVGETVVDGGITNGTISTSTPVSYTGAAKNFTIGLELTSSAQITGTDAGICNNGTLMPVTFVVAGSAPLSLTYLINGANPTTLTNLAEGTHIVNFTYGELYAISGIGSYIITISQVLDKNGISGIVLAGDATLTLFSTPNPIISGPTTVMISTSNNYSVTNTAGNTYVWSVASTTGGASAILTNSLTSTVSATWGATPGTVTLQLVETTPAPNSCSTTITYLITIRDWPVIVGNFNVCANSIETYQSKNIGGHTYIWTVLGGVIQSGSGTYSISVLWSTETAGTITLQQGVGPYTEVSQNVTINSAPTATLTVDGSSDICQDETVTLLLGRSGASATYTYTLEKDDAAYQTFTQATAPLNPHSFTTENLIWDGAASGKVYKFSLRVVNNTTGCSSAKIDQNVTVWKTPETGPEYHIPNN